MASPSGFMCVVITAVRVDRMAWRMEFMSEDSDDAVV